MTQHLSVNLVANCLGMLEANEAGRVTYADGDQVWQAKRIKNGYQFVMISGPDGGIRNEPLPFPSR